MLSHNENQNRRAIILAGEAGKHLSLPSQRIAADGPEP
jgi:hypothetical protein